MMGILAHSAEMIKSLNLPLGFSVCELGDQLYRANEKRLPARYWYQENGCGEYTAIDADGMGTLCADLNRPLPANIGTFDLVTDFGTGEHIFNQAQVWMTMHEITRNGGHIAFDRPKTGWPNHGFYNINDCLILDIAAANDYTVVHMATNPYPGKGDMLCGLLRKNHDKPFVIPNQGKYKERLKV